MPGGWFACCGCSSCCGSPSSTRLFAPADTASTSASDICPASSMNRTSTLSRNSGRAQSHDVPPSSEYSPREKARRAFVVVDRVQLFGIARTALAFVQALEIREPLLGRALAHRPQQVADGLVADGRHADLLPGLQELEDHVRPRERLAGSGRALDRQHAVVELEPEAARLHDLRVDAFARRADRCRKPLLARAARGRERDHSLLAGQRAARHSRRPRRSRSRCASRRLARAHSSR